LFTACKACDARVFRASTASILPRAQTRGRMGPGLAGGQPSPQPGVNTPGMEFAWKAVWPKAIFTPETAANRYDIEPVLESRLAEGHIHHRVCGLWCRSCADGELGLRPRIPSARKPFPGTLSQATVNLAVGQGKGMTHNGKLIFSTPGHFIPGKCYNLGNISPE